MSERTRVPRTDLSRPGWNLRQNHAVLADLVMPSERRTQRRQPVWERRFEGSKLAEVDVYFGRTLQQGS
jgi:hypothetical protein